MLEEIGDAGGDGGDAGGEGLRRRLLGGGEEAGE